MAGTHVLELLISMGIDCKFFADPVCVKGNPWIYMYVRVLVIMMVNIFISDCDVRW